MCHVHAQWALPMLMLCTRLLSQNSTLVLTAEHRNRDAHEPSSEPTSLWGQMGKTKMGDRALRERPRDEEGEKKVSLHEGRYVRMRWPSAGQFKSSWPHGMESSML